MLLKLPCVPLELFDKPKFFTFNVDVTSSLITLVVCLVFIWGQLFLYFAGTLYHIYKNKAQSAKTSKLQKQFFKILCIQILFPFVVMFLYVYFANVMDLMITNIGMIVISTHGLSSTLIILFAHKPYREATQELVGMKKKTVMPVSFLVAKTSALSVK